MSAPAQDWVFVAHSQHDHEGQEFLLHVFNQPTSRFRPYFYTVERPEPPHAEKIREKIRAARSMIVLLSKHMVERPHTRAWVGYEVGIASQIGIPVVVVDPAEAPIDLPVPGANLYLQRPATARGGLSNVWKIIAETGGHLKPSEKSQPTGEFWDDLLTALYDFSMAQHDSTGVFHWVTCGFANCRSRFFVPYELYQSKGHPCPSCRQPNASWWVGVREFAENYEKQAQQK